MVGQQAQALLLQVFLQLCSSTAFHPLNILLQIKNNSFLSHPPVAVSYICVDVRTHRRLGEACHQLGAQTQERRRGPGRLAGVTEVQQPDALSHKERLLQALIELHTHTSHVESVSTEGLTEDHLIL